MMNNNIENIIKDIIHDIITNDTSIYSALCFSESKKLQDFTFNFNFTKTESETELKNNVLFFIDNIIAKILEINYNVDYRTTKNLGGTITYNNIVSKNDFIINDYIFLDNTSISNLDLYIEDLKIIENNNKYTITLKLPILELDKTNIVIK